MSVKSQITRIEGAKADIIAAITEMGVTVPDGTMLDGLADLIRQIGRVVLVTSDGYRLVTSDGCSILTER